VPTEAVTDYYEVLQVKSQAIRKLSTGFTGFFAPAFFIRTTADGEFRDFPRHSGGLSSLSDPERRASYDVIIT